MPIINSMVDVSAAEQAAYVRDRMPERGLFAGHHWRVAPEPFALGAELAEELEAMGRVLLQFNRAVNLLYRYSLEGREPRWVAEWLDRGKPQALLEWQRAASMKNELPCVIRPDLLLTEEGLTLVELDAVPGGIGLTAWLNQTYADLGMPVIGGARGMMEGFESLFPGSPRVHVVISEEASTYRPEMVWLCDQLNSSQDRVAGDSSQEASRLNGIIGGNGSSDDSGGLAGLNKAAPRFQVRDGHFYDFQPGDGIYRFFELFDLANQPNAEAIIQAAVERRIRLTAPPKPIFEEKMLFALLWNRNLAAFWRRELGEGFLRRMKQWTPYSWVVDPTPWPPQAAVPQLDLTDWQQLKSLSQKERELILKISGFSDKAWGSRGLVLGSDVSQSEWSRAVDEALASFATHPYVLQRYHKPRTMPARWFDFEQEQAVEFAGRVRLCPYYFVSGEGDAGRARLSGVLATICPADKKIIHGMTEAVLAPCLA